MLKHLAERCYESKAPSLAGTRTDSRLYCAAQAAFASLYQSGHTPTRSHPSYLHALAARLACGKGPPPEYLPRLNLTIGPRDRAFKRLRRCHRCMCPRLALVGWLWVMGCLKCSISSLLTARSSALSEGRSLSSIHPYARGLPLASHWLLIVNERRRWAAPSTRDTMDPNGYTHKLIRIRC